MDKKWYIWLDGIQVPVNEEVYRTYKRAEWREDKQSEAHAQRESSYEFMSEHGFDGQAVADQELVDEIVADKLLLDELYTALSELTDNERNLIDKFFYQEKSEREIAEETGIPRNTLVYRKNKILKKLKKIIEKS